MHYLFVHGTLRRGLGLHRILEKFDAKFLGTTQLYRPDSVMVGLSRTSYPSVVRVPIEWIDWNEVPIAAPVGELYDISNECRNYLDAVEGTPVFYQRLQGEVVLTEEMLPRIYGERPAIKYPRRNLLRCEYYGMAPDNRSLNDSIIVNNGDWTKPDFGMRYREWEQRSRDRDWEELNERMDDGERPPHMREFKFFFEGKLRASEDTRSFARERERMRRDMEERTRRAMRELDRVRAQEEREME